MLLLLPSLIVVALISEPRAATPNAIVGDGSPAPKLGLSGTARDSVPNPKALARVRALQPAVDAFARGAAPSGTNALAAWMRTMTAELRRLEAELTVVVAMRDPVATVAAVVRIGDLYWAFADAVEAVPLPSALTNDDERAAYRAALAAQGDSIRERAVELWNRAATFAAQHGVDASEARARLSRRR